MAGVATEESGAVRLFEGVSRQLLQQQHQGCQSVEALAEWRSSEQVENGIPSTSPPYWDSDDDDDGGPKPVELYGKYTWKIDKFSQINKRELRSNAFEVGGYKWYILIYPQGCDVCNHLSLFLCVANHDKLLPGWSHFAQFTIAVVNKDPKKSKYSDTLHRFWKKEHDWGWKKFMELSKVLDGFVDGDTLIIKAQVQVIRERVDRPFRCLDCQYRRELVRVYLKNVEQTCRHFVEERRGKLLKLIEDKTRWSSFCAFWLGMDQSSRRRMSREKTESILKVVVKHFFIEKEVTSTLVMDSLYSGLKALEGQIKGKKSKGKYLAAEELPVPIVRIEKDSFFLVDDVLLLLERAAVEPLPPKDEKGPQTQNRTKDGAAGEEFNKDSIECDERRLTELGRRTIEIFVLANIFSKIEVAYKEAVSLKRQEELIREEEAAWLAETELKGKRRAMDKDKKSKKKQGKQKRNSRKGKDKGRDDKPNNILEVKIEQDNPIVEKEDFAVVPEMILEKSDVAEDVSDVSDSLDRIPEIPPPDSEDRDMSPVNWDTDTSEVQPPIGASSSETNGLSGVQYGIEGRNSSVVDDSSSTCSSDSVPSVVLSVHHKGNSHYHQNPNSPIRGRNYQSKMTSDSASWVNEERTPPSEAVRDAGHPHDASQRSNMVDSLSQATVHSLQDRVVNRTKQHVEEENGSLHTNFSVKDDVDGVISGDRAACIMSLPRSPSKIIPSIAPKLESNIDAISDQLMVRKPSSDSPKQPDRPMHLTNSPENDATLKPDTQKLTTPKPSEKPSGHQIPIVNVQHSTQHVSVATDKSSMASMPALSRPLSAPLNPGPRPAVSIISMVQTAPILARSVSATGRLGPEPTASTASSYAPQSYLNAMIGSSVTGSLSAYSQNHSASSVANALHSYPQASSLVSVPPFSPHCSDRKDPSSIHPSFSFGMVNCHDVMQNAPLLMECPQRNVSRNLPGDHLASLVNDMQSFDLYNPVHIGSQDHHSLEFSACTSGRQSHVLADEFPHLDIINDLLDDEHGTAKVARGNAGYQSFSNGPQHMNRQFSFSSDLGMTNGLGQSTNSCRLERTQSYHDDGFQYGCGASKSSYDTVRDAIPQASPRQYVNGQIDGSRPDQWQMGVSDMPFLSVRNMDNGGYPYHIPEFPNLTVGVNGYTVFRPSNGF